MSNLKYYFVYVPEIRLIESTFLVHRLVNNHSHTRVVFNYMILFYSLEQPSGLSI